MFSSNKDRLTQLRIEEYNALANDLLKTNSEFADLAHQNLKLFDGCAFTMKVQEIGFGKHIKYTDVLTGEISNKGYAYCNRVPTMNVFGSFPSLYKGQIDHLGRISITAVETQFKILNAPKFLEGTFSTEGKFELEVNNADLERGLDTLILKMIGDPFNNNVSSKRMFLETRDKLNQIIKLNRAVFSS